MAHTFGQAPELALAIPFENLSFQSWENTLPDQWKLDDGSPTGARVRYNPGFDLTRALQITDTGVVSSAANGLIQEIDLPDYIPNGQLTKVGGTVISDLEGSYGAAIAAITLAQNSGAYYIRTASAQNNPEWALIDYGNSTNPINTAYSDISLLVEITSYDSEEDPGGVFDCLFAHHGRTVSERSYVFAYRPSFHDKLIEAFLPGARQERGGIGKLRSYDTMGGIPKWRVIFPFSGVPASFVEVLEEFWAWNKGLQGFPGVHLMLYHYLTDPAAAHTGGHEYLRTPPYIICDIVENTWPFSPSGAYLGAGIYDGTLTFEEV